MNMTIPIIILFGAILLGLSQTPVVIKDFWQEVKEIFDIK